jgi:glycosyltransferase involved in cell wall biosynthesis
MAMYANVSGLINAGHHVKVLAMNTNKYFVKPEELPEDFKSKTRIEFIYNDLSIKPLDAFLNIFSDKSYHVQRFISKDFEKKLIEILQQEDFDIVQLEMLYMTPYADVVRKHSQAKIILRSHNIEHLLWQRITSITRNPIKKAYLSLLSKRLKNYEINNLGSYDGIVTISDRDARYFKELGTDTPIIDVPFGMDLSGFEPGKPDYEYPSLFHLGSMNWVPNEEGIKWFIDHAWPLIHKKYPEVKFYLAGRMMPQWLLELNAPNIEVVGEVPDAREFIESKAVMIVPLFSGSGIRIKIIEGMALGKPIISTGIGAEGIDYTAGKNILVADTPDEFLAAVDKCFSDKSLCDNLGKNARQLIEDKYRLEKVIEKLEGFYRRVLEN